MVFNVLLLSIKKHDMGASLESSHIASSALEIKWIKYNLEVYKNYCHKLVHSWDFSDSLKGQKGQE